MDSYEAIIEYLLGCGLLHPSAIVCTGFSVVDVSRRNRNLRLELSCGGGYFIKVGVDHQKRRTLAQESRTYGFLKAVLGKPAASSLARVHLFDPGSSILVLELLASETLGAVYLRRPRLVPSLIRKLGKRLGELHRDLVESRRVPEGCEQFCPVPFELWRPSNTFVETCSGANLEFLKILQRSEGLCRALESLSSGWRHIVDSMPVLIHGDIRLDNCCLAADRKSLRIVDWELAGKGDPAWDVGAVFADLLSGWVMSIPLPTGADPAQYLRFAGTPFEALKRAALDFWTGYQEGRGLSAVEISGALRTCILYAAARLIQLAFEHLQGAQHVTMYAISHLQVSDNLLARPIDGAALLLGLAA